MSGIRTMLRYIMLTAVTAALLTPLSAIADTDLDGTIDPTLQAGLEQALEEIGLAREAGKGKLAVALVDVSQAGRPRTAMLNGHDMFYAASLPKIAILLGAAVSLDNGSLSMNPALDKDIQDMIRYSCNECASRVLEEVGREELITILQSPQYHFYDPEAGGGLWVGKPYGPESAYQRDPLAGFSHGATVFQAARFYYLLNEKTLVSPEQSEMMLRALSRPALKHKFVKGLDAYDGLEIYRKSGTWKRSHADSALVVSGDYRYIMVALAEDREGSEWLERLARRLHPLVTGGDG